MIGIADCDWSVPKPWSDLCQSISYILRTTATDDTLVAWKLAGLRFVLEVQEHFFTASAQWNDYILRALLRAHFHDPAKPANMKRWPNWISLQLVVFLKERKRDVGMEVSLLALYWSRKFAFTCFGGQELAVGTIVEEVEVWGGFDCLCILELKICPHLSRKKKQKKTNLHKVVGVDLRLNILQKYVLCTFLLSETSLNFSYLLNFLILQKHNVQKSVNALIYLVLSSYVTRQCCGWGRKRIKTDIWMLSIGNQGIGWYFQIRTKVYEIKSTNWLLWNLVNCILLNCILICLDLKHPCDIWLGSRGLFPWKIFGHSSWLNTYIWAVVYCKARG